MNKKILPLLTTVLGIIILMTGLLSIKIPDFSEEVDFSYMSKLIPLLLIGLLITSIGYFWYKGIKKKEIREAEEEAFLEKEKIEAMAKMNAQSPTPIEPTKQPQTFTNQ